MTNEQIARLIVDAYNMGEEDGHNDGYDKGYNVGYSDSDDEGDQKAFDNGYEKGYETGYEAAREEFEVIADGSLIDEDEEEEEEMSPAQWYDAGWNDGYGGYDPNKEMNEDRVYMWGYKDGREQLDEETKAEEKI